MLVITIFTLRNACLVFGRLLTVGGQQSLEKRSWLTIQVVYAPKGVQSIATIELVFTA
jgi:hypothetical protein